MYIAFFKTNNGLGCLSILKGDGLAHWWSRSWEMPVCFPHAFSRLTMLHCSRGLGLPLPDWLDRVRPHTFMTPLLRSQLLGRERGSEYTLPKAFHVQFPEYEIEGLFLAPCFFLSFIVVCLSAQNIHPKLSTERKVEKLYSDYACLDCSENYMLKLGTWSVDNMATYALCLMGLHVTS